MRCEMVSDEFSALADGTATLAPEEQHHVEHCLRCQAEVAQYRKLLRALRSLRTEVFEPSPSIVAEVIAAIEMADEHPAVRAMVSVVGSRRLVYLGGIAAATAAGAAGIVLANRGRRSLVG